MALSSRNGPPYPIVSSSICVYVRTPSPNPKGTKTTQVFSIHISVSQKLVKERANQLVSGEQSNVLNLESEVLAFHTNCPDCNAPCKTNMKITREYHLAVYKYTWLTPEVRM